MSYTFNYNMNNLSCSQNFNWESMAMMTLGSALGQTGFGSCSLYGGLGGILNSDPSTFFGCGSSIFYDTNYMEKMAGFQLGYTGINIAGGIIGKAIREHKAEKAEQRATAAETMDNLKELKAKLTKYESQSENPELYVADSFDEAIKTAEGTVTSRKKTLATLEAKLAAFGTAELTDAQTKEKTKISDQIDVLNGTKDDKGSIKYAEAAVAKAELAKSEEVERLKKEADKQIALLKPQLKEAQEAVDDLNSVNLDKLYAKSIKKYDMTKDNYDKCFNENNELQIDKIDKIDINHIKYACHAYMTAADDADKKKYALQISAIYSKLSPTQRSQEKQVLAICQSSQDWLKAHA